MSSTNLKEPLPNKGFMSQNTALATLPVHPTTIAAAFAGNVNKVCVHEVQLRRFPKQPSTFYGGCRFCQVPTCCTKNAKNGMVEPPFITSFDRESLPELHGLQASTIKRANLHTGRTNVYLKPAPHGGCPFYQNGSCVVYARRPLDCRLFPLDLRFRSDEYLLLLYDFPGCKNSIEATAINDGIDYFEALAQLFGSELQDYATAEVPGMDQMLSHTVVARYTPSSFCQHLIKGGPRWLTNRNPRSVNRRRLPLRNLG